MNPNDYSTLLAKIRNKYEKKLNDKVLIIDSMNLFIRNFVMLKTLNPEGQHIGGLVGFLKSLGLLTRLHDPTRVICVFDGKGSSINRRNINPNYKSNRDNVKVTNWEMYDSRKEEKEGMDSQMGRLLDYLEVLPIHLLSLEKVEADDIISYISQEFSKRGSEVVIVSSDKDFLQIVNENINVFSPSKKELIGVKDVKVKTKVPPYNYLILKALTGDKSDNLRGPRGVGVGRVVKYIPEILDSKIPLSYIYKKCEDNIDGNSFYSKVIFDWDLVEKNYDLMNLEEPRLTEEEKNIIVETLLKPLPDNNSGVFQYYLEQDKIETLSKNVEGWLQQFRGLTLYN